MLNSRGVGTSLPIAPLNTPYGTLVLSQQSLLGTVSCFQPKGLVKVVSSEHLLSHLLFKTVQTTSCEIQAVQDWVELKVLNSMNKFIAPIHSLHDHFTSVRWRCARPCPRVQGQEVCILIGAETLLGASRDSHQSWAQDRWGRAKY